MPLKDAIPSTCCPHDDAAVVVILPRPLGAPIASAKAAAEMAKLVSLWTYCRESEAAGRCDRRHSCDLPERAEQRREPSPSQSAREPISRRSYLVGTSAVSVNLPTSTFQPEKARPWTVSMAASALANSSGITGLTSTTLYPRPGAQSGEALAHPARSMRIMMTRERLFRLHVSNIVSGRF